MNENYLPEVLLQAGMQVEFDESKDDKNRYNHKYSLSCAEDILEEIMFGFKFFIWDFVKNSYERFGEERFKIVTKYGDDHVFLVFTHRTKEDGDVNLRAISLRPTHEDEVEAYNNLAS